MENINDTKISMTDYNEIESRIDMMRSEKELIETHKNLVGKSCKNSYWEIKDCGVEFIKEFLSRDWGRSIVYHYSEGAQKFIQSKYLSDYFKNSIKELLSDKASNEVLNILNSDKVINDMSEGEISLIYNAINEFYDKSQETDKVNASAYIMSFLYKLNGSGVIAFIRNNVSDMYLATHILLTSGLNDRASFYSGRGVNYGDLNENNLVAIFTKLLKFDVNYALNFVEMVCHMKTLGATEFINKFKYFSTNKFKLDELSFDDSNVSLDGVYGEARNLVAAISLFSVMSRGNDENYQIYASEQIKSSFMAKIRPILQSINPNYNEKDDQSFGFSYSIKK